MRRKGKIILKYRNKIYNKSNYENINLGGIKFRDGKKFKRVFP